MGTGPDRSRRRLTAVVALLVVGAAHAAAAEACAPDSVTFRTEAGDVRFSAEVVDTEESRARGLMFRQSMAPDHGMLFVYPTARRTAFWMKNTPLPLDIIFLNRQGVVCSIAEDATPFSLEHIPSVCAAQTVFEVNAGQARATGVAVGSVARHPAILAPLWSCE